MLYSLDISSDASKPLYHGAGCMLLQILLHIDRPQATDVSMMFLRSSQLGVSRLHMHGETDPIYEQC